MRATTVASYGGTKFSSMREPQVVLTPLVQMLSLTAIGMAMSGMVFRHLLSVKSSSSASFTSASFFAVVMNALTLDSTSKTRWK